MRAYGLTDPGLVRGTNEDAFLCDGVRRVFVVADGMGGHAAGEVASRLAIDSIAEYFAAHRDGAGAPVTESALSADGHRLRAAIEEANDRVYRAAAADERWTGMGTTVVGAMLSETEDRVAIGHVGDSRLYLFADGELTQLTRDDSWAEMAWARETAGAEAPGAPPARNVLTNVLGIRPAVEVHVSERALTGPGTLLLCSDGLHAHVPHATIEDILIGAATIEDAVRALVDAANAHGGPDNVTALAVAYGVETMAAGVREEAA